jgi:hypothetical protein
VDGDGLPDLLHNSERIWSGDFLTAELMYRRNLGGRSFGPPQPLGVDLFWFDRVMASLDLDGTRGDELLIVRSYPNALDSLRVFTNVGGKRYVLDHTEPIQFDRPVSHRYWERADRLFVGDMNGDGRRDIVVFSTSFWWSGYFSVLLGGHDHRFHLADTQRYGSEPVGIAVADLNADGILDVVLADANTNRPSRMYVFQGHVDGSMELVSVRYPGNYPVDIVAADFDGDGLPDIALPTVWQGVVAMFRNAGEPPPKRRVLAAVHSAKVEDGVARVEWQLTAPVGVAVEKSGRGNHWERTGIVPQIIGTSVVITDANITSPGRIGYRLRSLVPAVFVEGSEAWINPMRRGGLRLQNAVSIEQGAGIALDLSVESAAPLQIELFDLLGRRLVKRRVTQVAAGSQQLRLDLGVAPRNGAYWLRVSDGAQTAVTRVVVVR